MRCRLTGCGAARGPAQLAAPTRCAPAPVRRGSGADVRDREASRRARTAPASGPARCSSASGSPAFTRSPGGAAPPAPTRGSIASSLARRPPPMPTTSSPSAKQSQPASTPSRGAGTIGDDRRRVQRARAARALRRRRPAPRTIARNFSHAAPESSAFSARRARAAVVGLGARQAHHHAPPASSVSARVSAGPRAAQHLARLAHLERVADGAAERPVHVGDERRGARAQRSRRGHEPRRQAARGLARLHERAAAALHVVDDRARALGDLLAHDAARR